MNEQSILQYQRKVKTVDELCALIGPRPRQKKVIMCHGTFDIVHPGHVRHLIYAKSKGEILVASVTADAHISKANVRPYVPEDLRAVNLAAFEMVDYVIIDREPTPLKNLHRIQPDFFAKGYEYFEGGGLHRRRRDEARCEEVDVGHATHTSRAAVDETTQAEAHRCEEEQRREKRDRERASPHALEDEEVVLDDVACTRDCNHSMRLLPVSLRNTSSSVPRRMSALSGRSPWRCTAAVAASPSAV